MNENKPTSAAIDPADFQDVVVEPVKQVHAEFNEGGKVDFSYERCAPQEADAWSVYLRRKYNNEAMCVADCANEAHAMFVAAALKKAYPEISLFPSSGEITTAPRFIVVELDVDGGEEPSEIADGVQHFLSHAQVRCQVHKPATKLAKAVIIVQGGVVQGAYADTRNVAITLVDHDNLKAEGKTDAQREEIETQALAHCSYAIGLK